MKQIKLPFCKTCIKTGVLCGVCEQKIESGKYSTTDLIVCKEILNFFGKETGINNLSFEKSIEKNGLLVLIFGKGSLGDFFSHGGFKLIKKLEKTLNRKIRVLEYSKDENEMIRELLPIPIINFNTVYYPGDFVVLTIKIDKRDFNKIKKEKEVYEDLIKEITGVSYVELSP